MTSGPPPPLTCQPQAARLMKGTLYITGDAAADDLLNTDPLALILGMLLDHRVP